MTTFYNMDEFWEHYAKWNKKSTAWLHSYEVPRVDKFIDTENRMKVDMG